MVELCMRKTDVNTGKPWTVSEIARFCECDPKTVRNHQKGLSRASRAGKAPRKGSAERAVRAAAVKALALKRNKNQRKKFVAASDIRAALARTAKIECSARTIMRDLHGVGAKVRTRSKVPRPAPGDPAKRCTWCRQRWSPTMPDDDRWYCDEAWFCRNRVNAKEWCFLDDYPVREVRHKLANFDNIFVCQTASFFEIFPFKKTSVRIYFASGFNLFFETIKSHNFSIRPIIVSVSIILYI